MTDDSDHSNSSDASRFATCSRMDAMELAMRTAVVAHLIVCVLSLALLATLHSGLGVFVGFGVAAALASAIPFVILPVAAAIGFFTHLVLNGMRVSIPLLVRIIVILFEATLFGWIVVLIFLSQS